MSRGIKELGHSLKNTDDNPQIFEFGQISLQILSSDSFSLDLQDRSNLSLHFKFNEQTIIAL